MMIYFVIGLVGCVVIWYVSTFNQIKRLDIKITEAFGNIDVALSKRFHVLTQLFEVAKGYAKHEKETLAMVVELRQGMSAIEKTTASSQIEKGFDQIRILAESYPELKADALFMNLQEAAVDSEEHLQAARRMYNSNVSIYNQSIAVFPGNIVASSLNAVPREMLKFDQRELENPNLKY